MKLARRIGLENNPPCAKRLGTAAGLRQEGLWRVMGRESQCASATANSAIATLSALSLPHRKPMPMPAVAHNPHPTFLRTPGCLPDYINTTVVRFQKKPTRFALAHPPLNEPHIFGKQTALCKAAGYSSRGAAGRPLACYGPREPPRIGHRQLCDSHTQHSPPSPGP